jgi:hypothetical protein
MLSQRYCISNQHQSVLCQNKQKRPKNTPSQSLKQPLPQWRIRRRPLRCTSLENPGDRLVDRGIYNGRRVDFAKYAASFFNPYLFCGPFRSPVGCGACALALLTGVAPEVITEKNGGEHYSDDFMVRFLRVRGFSVLNLTMCNLSASSSKVGKQHVVLLSQLFQKNEGTWGAIHYDNYYHNFEVYSLEAISFLNKPILSAYLVVHPRWRSDHLATVGTGPKPKAKGESLTLASLGVAQCKELRFAQTKA